MDEGGVGEGYMGTGAAVVRDLLLLSGAAESCGPPRPHAWVVPIEFECSHVLLKESLGAAMSLCHDALAFRLISQSEPSGLRPLLDGLCRCVSMVVIVAQLDGPPFVAKALHNLSGQSGHAKQNEQAKTRTVRKSSRNVDIQSRKGGCWKSRTARVR